mmetsp:Transcript_10409/g.16325  ORF Transcript_10409/g.16325 Transcript_10409/m.16325 type:complete len:134 (+) Transcript_10409:94-495(+)|eukprot:CAMPEP_0117032706 /NCGR_PEP_ID=MMETSP0472-20121206/23432_1 /TAXON_ID=693140 ORGANISM="Tiarina fusus, Strain LIS" /NCGR_SAMPLE_ID=MMETSP0472 /ASSEMBLY_ACC=CAM_ASM_000603 /LENGTH=133 /DNA_ID=CAMNT_0004741435 /DNA_START=82 /DNA_END=483 /DNA_ORIENTATION=-
MNSDNQYSDSESGSDVSMRSVGFSTIEFHEHAMILGNNPSTSEGPSLEIDWQVQEKVIVDIDAYETNRPPRRIRHQLQMPGFVREDVLLSNGYSRGQISEHMRSVEKERRDFMKSKRFPQKMLSKVAKIMHLK